jgi:hypothetical protein
MKLSDAELALLTAQTDRPGANRSRAAAGEPGSRERPLSYAELIRRRRHAVGRDDA